MVYKMTKVIKEALDASKHELKPFIEETETSSCVWLQFNVGSNNRYHIRFISRDDDNDVAVRVFGLVSVESEEQKPKVLLAMNELNSKYRFVRFYMDNDGDVNVGYDYLMRDTNPATSAEELIVRIVDIVEDAYTVLMRAMWS